MPRQDTVTTSSREDGSTHSGHVQTRGQREGTVLKEMNILSGPNQGYLNCPLCPYGFSGGSGALSGPASPKITMDLSAKLESLCPCQVALGRFLKGPPKTNVH